MATQSQLAELSFQAKLDNIKTFHSSLKALNFAKNVTICIMSDGLRMIVEEAKYVQATIYMSRECFSEYCLLDDTPMEMRVDLPSVTNCLGMFAGADSSMKLMYKGPGAPLVFILEQHGEDDLITEVADFLNMFLLFLSFTLKILQFFRGIDQDHIGRRESGLLHRRKR